MSNPAALAELLGHWSAAKGPLYRNLSTALTEVIRSGDLPAGQRLPSERDLAKLLMVSRATVVAAYDELRGDGLIESLRGSGTRVSAGAGRPAGTQRRASGGRTSSFFQRLVDGPGEVISLARAVEPAAPELVDAIEDLRSDDLDEVLADPGYHPRGLPALRQAVAGYHADQHLPTVADQVLVTTGAQQAVGLVAQLYLRPGDTVVVEQPGWPGSLDVFRAVGARLVGVPLDEDGVRPDALANAFATHRPALAHLMPTFHNPTGTLMSDGRRRRVAELAGHYGVPVLEDNAYPGFTALSGCTPPPPIGAYACGGTEILTLGSLTNAVWAGLRIGWVRGPAGAIARLAHHKARADLGGPVLDQVLAARLLPKIADIAAVRGETLRTRLDHLRALLTERLPSWRWRSPDGGSALWVVLPGTNAQVFAQVALRHGVEVVPGSATDPTGGHDDHLRLPLTLPAEVITELVDRLATAWSELS